MKVVIDTNVMLVSIPDRSRCHAIFKAFLDEKYTLCITTDILDEYAEMFGLYANKRVAENTLEAIENAVNIEFITRYYRWQCIQADPDDDKFVDCAFAANADYIVTNDQHFNSLQTIDFPKVDVIGSDEFLKILTQE